ncbi:MAG: hypothetical protein M3O15_12865 [Acidobacteriota bacterium]|nr:hypothetical protein [Acidobacteriota bacterium]
MKKGRPTQEITHSLTLRVRVNPEVDQLVRRAAESSARRKGTGDLSTWIREVLVIAARRELAKGSELGS